MKILIDNGHGTEMHGAKQSPDGKLKEGIYAREIAKQVVSELKQLGYDAELVTPEDDDIKLNIRVQRINSWCNKLGSKNCLSVSIHCNAAGSDGKWHDAKGWSVFVSQNASTNSKRLAECLFSQATNSKLKTRQQNPGIGYWVQSLAMCRDTKCPSVLTENLFQDNVDDVNYLLSEDGKKTIIDLHVNGIINYINGKN